MWSVRASFFDHLRASVAGERRPLERDDFSSNRHPALSFCLSMISAQTLRVCREGKPVPTLGSSPGACFSGSCSSRSRFLIVLCRASQRPCLCGIIWTLRQAHTVAFPLVPV